MIPEKLVEFLVGPVILDLGTRDGNLRPWFNRVKGARVNPDRETITFFVNEARTEKMLGNLQDNGRVALVAGEVPSHETYQFKGSYVASKPSEETDLAWQKMYIDKLVSHLQSLGFPAAAMVRSFFPSNPYVAITFRVEEVFVQTPGPGAGDKMSLE